MGRCVCPKYRSVVSSAPAPFQRRRTLAGRPFVGSVERPNVDSSESQTTVDSRTIDASLGFGAPPLTEGVSDVHSDISTADVIQNFADEDSVELHDGEVDVPRAHSRGAAHLSAASLRNARTAVFNTADLLIYNRLHSSLTSDRWTDPSASFTLLLDRFDAFMESWASHATPSQPHFVWACVEACPLAHAVNPTRAAALLATRSYMPGELPDSLAPDSKADHSAVDTSTQLGQDIIQSAPGSMQLLGRLIAVRDGLALLGSMVPSRNPQQPHVITSRLTP